MADVRKRIVFYGRVQGVGFRYRAKYLARSLMLTGWVKNKYNGTVLMEIQGSKGMIDTFLERLGEGDYISIQWMDTKSVPLQDEYDFVVR